MREKTFRSVVMRYPVALVCAALIVVLVVVFFLHRDVVEALSAQEQEKDARIRVIEGNESEAKGLESDVEKLESLVQRVDGRLFQPEARSENKDSFYSFEDEFNVVIFDVRQLSDEPAALKKGGVNELKLHSVIVYELVVSGGYGNILRFIDGLYRAKPIMRVSDFKISQNQASGASGELLTFAFRVYVMSAKG